MIKKKCEGIYSHLTLSMKKNKYTLNMNKYCNFSTHELGANQIKNFYYFF